MAIDVSGISVIAPVLAFLLVVFVVAAILFKTKILGENKWVQIFVSLIVASLFVVSAGTREYVLTVIPWFGVLVVSLFIIMFLVGFVGAKAEFMQKGIGIVAVIIIGLVFLFSAFVVFSDVLVNTVGGGGEGSEATSIVFSWLFSARIGGAILLIIASALVSWILVKAK